MKWNSVRRHTRDQIALRSWWLLALRGLLAILFGIVALFFPGIALLAFIVVFAVYTILDGLVAIVIAIRERRYWHRWGWMLTGGSLTLLTGVFAVTYPVKTLWILLYIVATWTVLRGIIEIAAAFIWREYIVQEWALILAGVLSLAFGAFLFVSPNAGLLSIPWLLGAYCLLFGSLVIVRAFQLRSWASSVVTQTR